MQNFVSDSLFDIIERLYVDITNTIDIDWDAHLPVLHDISVYITGKLFSQSAHFS